MTIRFQCPACRQTLKAPAAQIGRTARCASCGAAVQVPAESEMHDARPVFVGEPASFQVRKTSLAVDDEIDMTPMIDVVFQLLIFFMVTTAMSLQKALPLPTPEATNAAAAQAETISDDDTVTVRVEADDSLWVDDTLAVSRHDLIAKLRKLRTQGRGGGGRALYRLLVSADPDAHHEAVVTALDAGGAAGMEEVRLLSDEGL